MRGDLLECLDGTLAGHLLALFYPAGGALGGGGAAGPSSMLPCPPQVCRYLTGNLLGLLQVNRWMRSDAGLDLRLHRHHGPGCDKFRVLS